MKKWYIENLNNPEPGKYPAYEINISSEKEANICTVWYSDLFSDEAKKNALLISKAPEMLEMLQRIEKILTYESIEPNSPIQFKMFQLINEATEL